MAKFRIAPYVVVRKDSKGQWHKTLHVNGKKVDLGKAKMAEIKFRRYKGD